MRANEDFVWAENCLLLYNKSRLLPPPARSWILTDSAACSLPFHSISTWHYETRVSGAATWDLSSQGQQQRFNRERRRQPWPATSTTDATQLEAPQAVSVFRRGRRRRRFHQGGKLVSWATAHGRPCSSWLASRLTGGPGQAGRAVHGGRGHKLSRQDLCHPGTALGWTSRLLHPCWGILYTPAGADRVGGGVHFQLSPPLGENERCPGWHPLRSHAAGHFYGWSASCVSTSSTTSKRMRMQHLPVLQERPSAGWERTAALTSMLPVVYHSIPLQPGAASRILGVLKIVCCCAINPDCRLHLLWSQTWTVVYHSSPLHMCWTEWGSMSAWVEVGSWSAPCRLSYHSRQGPTRSIQNGSPDDMAPTEDGEGYQILWKLCRHNFVSINLYKFYTSHQTLHCLRSTLHCLRSISTIQSNCLL